MNNCQLTFWGRTLTLNIEYDCFEGEDITLSQKTAYDEFYCSADKVLNESKHIVENYCLQNDKEKIGQNSIDNIFKYVMPKTIYIERSSKHVVAVLCAYRFNPEEGLAIVFEDCKFKEIGTENIIL